MIQGTVLIQDAATPRLRAIAGQATRPRGLMAACGKRVEVEYRRHFQALDRRGNGRGWWRSHFWLRVRSATSLTSVSDTGAAVTIASPELAFRVRGGTIRPKRGRFLALPTTSRAKEAGSPREGGISGLFFIRRRGGRGAYLAVRVGRAIRVQYRLLPSVTIPAMPEALIPRARLAGAVEQEAERYLRRELERRAAR